MAIVTPGIDLAKNVFALHGVDATGRAGLVRPSVARSTREVVHVLPDLFLHATEIARVVSPKLFKVGDQGIDLGRIISCNE
jgi:hypothetical protein